MIFNVKSVVKTFLSNSVSGRNIDVYDTDIFLVSYPKSGNTWLRFLIGNVLYDDFNFANMEELIPDIYAQNNKKLKQIKSPRILKSHEYFDPRYKKVIYVVRDPRSVFISYFEYRKKMQKESSDSKRDDFIDVFIEGKFNSFGSWSQNVKSWVKTMENSKYFLLIKYEDLKVDTEKNLRLILDFMDLDYDESKLQKAISKSSFKNMRLNEIENKGRIKVFKGVNNNLPFIRKGEVDEWRYKLSEENQKRISKSFKDSLEYLGYDV